MLNATIPTRKTIKYHGRPLGDVGFHPLLGCNDRMPRVTTVYSLDTEAEILNLAAWMNRYPETLAQRAARKYGVQLVELGVA